MTAIAVDSGGKAYVTGQTEGKNNTQFSVTSGAFQTSNAGSTDAGFVRVYNTTLSGAGSLLYSSFLGGSISTGPGNGDLPSGIAIDSLGRAVIVGRTDTSNFPVTADAYSSTNTSSGSDGATFLVVLNPSGAGSADLVSGTFFGSASSAGSVAMSGGKAVFVGSTNTNGLATAGSAQLARAGGSDAIVVSFTIVPTANTAPVLSGGNAFSGLLEDPVTNPGTLVSTLIAGKVTDPDTGALAGVAVTGLVMTNGVWQYSLNGGTSWNAFTLPSSAVATLLNSDTLTRVRFVPNANFNGTVSGGMSFRAWDRTSGTAGTTANTTTNGGSTAFGNSVSSADITVTSVNDVPGRTGGTVANLTVEQDAGLSSLGLGALAYGPGGGSDEAAQTLTYTVTAVPGAALGTIVLADGTTVVSAASSYSLAQLQGMQFKTAAFASGGPAAFSWSVIDSGGGAGVLAETLAVKINSAPSPAPSPAPAPGPAPAPAVSASQPLATTPTQPEDLIAVPTVGSSSSIASNITQRLASSTAVAARGNEVSQSDDAFLPVNAEGAAVQTLTQSTGQTSISPGVVLTPAVFVSADRRAFTPAALPVVEPEFAQINFLQGSAPSSLLDVERGLRSPALLEQLDRLREEIRKDLNLEQTVAITAAGVTFGMSVVYVLWLIRGGVLLGSYLSALPAWQVLDPLPVLERIKNPADEDDDSFEEFENNASDPVNSLRGY